MIKMKHLFLGLIATSVIAFTACSGTAEKKDENTIHDDHTQEPASSGDDDTSKKQGVFSELFAHYQHLTFALSSDNDKEAAVAAQGILKALPKIQTDGFSAEDKTTYEDIVADIQEHAEHISDNVGNIAHQREHLVTLSKDIYDITKTFGTDKPLYKVFCSMYDDNRGAYWISDSKEIKNPFYGAEMLSCGEIQEELK